MERYDEKGVKRRMDGAGTEFGMIHRQLGPGFLMFDVDRLSAIVEMDLELRREDECFVEYRHNNARVQFTALFEVKKHKTQHSIKALDSSESSTLARNEIARRLGCRMFVVFGTNGTRPFEFWELEHDTDKYTRVGVLDYKPGDSERAMRAFWRDVLRLERFCFSSRTTN